MEVIKIQGAIHIELNPISLYKIRHTKELFLLLSPFTPHTESHSLQMHAVSPK